MSSTRARVGAFAIPFACFMVIGVVIWGWNAWRLLRGRSIPAVVLSSGVTTSRGRNGTSYAPRVEYRYAVDGTPYTSTKVFPGSGESRGRDWAEATASRFAVGDSTTAFVNPSDPSDAYLVRQPSAGPLFVIVFPLAITGLLIVAGDAHEDDPMPPPDPRPQSVGRWALTPSLELAEVAAGFRPAARRWQFAAAAVLGAHGALAVWCAAMAGSFVGKVGTLWRSTLGDGFFLVALVALGGMGYFIARRQRTATQAAAQVRGARLLVDRPVVRLGETVEAVPQLTLAGPARPDLALRLEVTTNDVRTNKRVHHEVVAPNGDPSSGAGAELRSTFALPPQGTPSSMRADESPRTRWAFVVRVRLANGRDAELRFPVRVHAPA